MNRWFATAALLLGVAACSKPKGPWIDRVEVDAFQGGEVISLSKEQLEQQLRTRLTAAKFNFVTDDKKPPEEVKPWRVSLAAGLTEPELESRTSQLELVLEVSHTGTSDPFVIDRRRTLTAPEAHDVETTQNAIRDALSDALDLAVREAAALIALETAPVSTLEARLGDADEAVKSAAVRLLVRQHHKAALPALVKRLETDDLDVLRSVVGMLVELRAPEAVNPLVEAANRKGPVFQREVVFAVGTIGGDDAEAYLDLVATGHDDPLIRASAEQALSELRARKNKTPRGDPR